MNITKETIKETLRQIMAEESEYQTFFKKALEKAGKSIPSMSDEEKKEFFNKIDAAWNAKGEKNEGNAFGAAVVAAKKAGKDEFEVGGKTYKVEESVGCGCGCGGVTEGGCSTNISEGRHDKTLDKIADLVKASKSFMDIGKELKKAKIKNYHFSTSMLPMYVINIDGAKIAILNKKYADGAERIVGTTAIGLMESFTKVIKEGRAFVQAARKAKEEGKTEFEFNGKTYPVTLKEELINEKRLKKVSMLKDVESGNTSRVEGVKISKDLAFELRMFLQRPMLARTRTGIAIDNSQMKDAIPMLAKVGIHKRLSSGVKKEFADLLKKYK